MPRESRLENSLFAPKASLSSQPEKVYDIIRLGHTHVTIRDTDTGHSTTAKTKNLRGAEVLPPRSLDEYLARFVK